MPVRDLESAEGFYGRLFGRPADAHPMPTLAEWHYDGSGLQVTLDADRAGGGMATLLVTDLSVTAEGLAARGIHVDRTAEGTAVAAYAGLDDPDGNRITLVQP